MTALCLPEPRRSAPARTEHEDARQAALDAARKVSAAIVGKAAREALSPAARMALAQLDGSLARLDTLDGRLPGHWGGRR